MEYDSASSCDGHLRDFEASEELPRFRGTENVEHPAQATDSAPWHSLQVVASQAKGKLGTANRSLSSQVMEYYHKYSQNANLDQYFSLPAASSSPESFKYYYSIYELNPKVSDNRQDCIGEEYTLRSYVPRERRRWVRPPLIGQSSNTESSSRYAQPLSNPDSPSPDLKRVTPETILEEKNEGPEILQESAERKISSPTSSIASHKPLEWDSGADVGYFNILLQNKQTEKKFSTIERMALARGCSAALRLDPEGTTESGISGKLAGAPKTSMTPDANSTPLLGNASGSESEIEITPIVKNHLPGIIAGSNIKSTEPQDIVVQYSKKEQSHDTPKSTFTFKVPCAKPAIEVKKVTSKQNVNKENVCPPTSPLKKSTSMNTLAVGPSKVTLKRSQSELNLYARDKNGAALPFIFNSSSSIATIVNKPSTCDKVIQTSLNIYTQESVGVQVSVQEEEEEKPPLPKRGTSLEKSMTLLMKNIKGTYKVPGTRRQEVGESSTKEEKSGRSGSGQSRNGSRRHTPQPEDNTNTTGRANSFEYFPGHVYENVPNGSGSHISSSDTARSHSTLPNTSSSINEKLWGDSDSLVKDLERSVNILKSLVDANKCDKEVKKRLIHHVVKRLITAKYTDDKIEHNLEDNVPWNPDDARNRVYGREILQALTKKHSTSESSSDWNIRRETVRGRKAAGSVRGILKDIALQSSSDKIDKNTDRTETDGRKARMGLRSDDYHRSNNTTTDPDKSESSECFFPQRSCNKASKVQDIFCAKERCKMSRGNSSTTNSTPPDHNRMLLDAVVNNRRLAVPSTNITDEEQANWRLLTTLSERQFELKKCTNSDSGDSKLVSYAEMEKRNQLIWITNEISHLCNLKKLLEEPRRSEKSRMSPRKSKSMNFRVRSENGYLERNGVDTQGNSTEDPWSSHCNLASCQPLNRAQRIIQRIKKRNSCAQTATNVTGAHSKTGGEIVSASSRYNSTMKLVNTGVQTVPQESSTAPTLIQSEVVHFIKCPAHDAMHFQSTCKRNERECVKHHVQNMVSTCAHCLQEQKEQSNGIRKVHANGECFQEDSPAVSRVPPEQVNGNSSSEVIHCCGNKESNQSKQKETKNQINASKVKHVCDCRCMANEIDNKRLPSKGHHACPSQLTTAENGSLLSKCENCRKTTHGREREEENSEEYGHPTSCECENDQSKKNGLPIRSTPISLKFCQEGNGHASNFEQNGCLKLCECPTDCSCDNAREQEAVKAFCGCHTNGKDHHNGTKHHGRCVTETDERLRPYYMANGQSTENSQCKVQNGLKCNCERDCSCSNRVKDDEEKLHRMGKIRGGNNKATYVDQASTTEPDAGYKHCRRCGAQYQNVKKCNCSQTYPKAVAYEISFTKNDRRGSNSTSSTKVPLANRASGAGKTDSCVCNVVNRAGSSQRSQQRDTLQDYLTRNKADFVSNAETRRQYLSEISHLRQLRKEKRIQLLAIASTSNVLKSPKVSSKPAVYLQKRMSDEEMRERLRKRYLRLSEVRHKKRQREKQEEARRNKLMAKIFCKKLQQKVLRGQVDLSQSVSVISNI